MMRQQEGEREARWKIYREGSKVADRCRGLYTRWLTLLSMASARHDN
jgi:hypothetical protein